jgi:hypothetical protein
LHEGVASSAMVLVVRRVLLITIVAESAAIGARYGSLACAWFPLATEPLVAIALAIGLRHRISFRPALAVSQRRLLACGALAAVGLTAGGSSAVAVGASVVAFLITIVAARGWPHEFFLPRPLRAR